MFRDPYVIILDDQSELEMEWWGDGDEEMEEEQEILASNKEAIEKNPNLILYPWAPLATNRDFYIRLEEVVTVYDPHGQVTEKYIELIEAKDGESKDSSS